jgi:glycosyltransferase involved in cell wall biosynthesis
MKILINASNLHAGGGVQVATSFIKELSYIDPRPHSFHILVSSEVDRNLNSIRLNKNVYSSYTVHDFKGLLGSIFHSRSYLKGYDLVFSVFGPIYVIPKLEFHIVGFADPWVAYSKNEIYKKYSVTKKIICTTKILIKKYFFSKYNHLIVELPHVKSALSKIHVLDSDSISVVENALPSTYFEPKLWRPIDFSFDFKSGYDIVFGFLGRGYQHKNLNILIDVDKILRKKYKLQCSFIFTLTQDEMKLNKFDELDNFISVGAIMVDQCPTFYQHIDALIFPSLLECFSVTPLEAMIMKKQVIASDRTFIRDVCKEHAYYFNPLDSNDIAYTINKYHLDRSLIDSKIEKAYTHAMHFSSARIRAEKYFRIINDKVDSLSV